MSDEPLTIPSRAFLEELQNAAGEGLLRQFAFDDLTAELAWSCNPRSGLLTIAGLGEFQAEVIATWSAISQTWRWVWDNEAAEIPREYQEAAMQAFGLGVKRVVPELFREQFSTHDVDANSVALVTAVHSSGCFFRAVHDAGIAFLFVRNPSVEAVEICSNEELRSTLLRIVNDFPANHRSVAHGLLLGQGFNPRHESAAGSSFLRNAEKLTLDYDEYGRLKQMGVEGESTDRACDFQPVGLLIMLLGAKGQWVGCAIVSMFGYMKSLLTSAEALV